MRIQPDQYLQSQDNLSTLDLIEKGRAVVQIEARALDRLAKEMDAPFAEAVKIIIASKMRVVVTGMGKSGHIGRKIAATLAATGTPAIFIHPAEAAHGDLGMLVPGDVLIVMSNSGDTAELRAIMAYAKSLGCNIIGIASRVDSAVMRSATVRLVLPDAREACPVNIAPTTSTTMTLALGDALAVAVMGVRCISREALQTLHPGGSIGRRLALVSEFMRTGDALPLVTADCPMREALVTMTTKSLGIAGVMDDDGGLIGVITDGDLRRHVDHLLTSAARDVMSVRPRTISVDKRATDALLILSEERITALFVVESHAPDRPIGIVHIHDLTGAGAA